MDKLRPRRCLLPFLVAVASASTPTLLAGKLRPRRGPSDRRRPAMFHFFRKSTEPKKGLGPGPGPEREADGFVLLDRRGRPPLRERARLSEGRGSPELGGLQPRGGAAQGCALHLGTARAGSPGHSRRPSAALAELPGQRRSVAVLVRFYSGEFRAL
ncbi:UBAP1-MVB12-associated (UMA)-domain containing protein 1 isoform X5 [Monodelphis domestica]|uniref:UBAP1-MVB12-associated (UMA)-domain containing protein 1 isoform X5 n=1 Tax=Monodelphis domestica TaxID=13616 RepID=UPI0024E27311|nr:UBAP1-MVB12-associated (UMA)-domain containing protein 1 isoform X5 [Monodelphis domestica]